jgi:hypothetical protein
MRALTHIEKKNPGATGIAAGAIRKYIGNVIHTEFIDSPQA